MFVAPDSKARESLHRLLLLVATEPNPARLRQRVDQEVDLLREAMSLYAGLQQPQGTTAARIEGVCQVYDVDLPAFMMGLGTIVGAPVEDDPRTMNTPVAAGVLFPNGPCSATVFGADRTPQSNPVKSAATRHARRKAILGCGTMALLAAFFMTVFHAGGSLEPTPPTASVAEASVPNSPPPTVSARVQPEPAKTGEHWVKLASAVRRAAPTALDQSEPVAEP
ncbi:MAG: hypothetical protein AUK55_12630 [Syntrophobacteraceae bacterium CG2_30_61_12]|nr:MAG: hypothetical protein AUK55_12630 [Syntrophobacteraceae bacterium CG2_30_61_12]PIU32829.1 MAG: hypothetical protein COT06_00615 [Syntrophobacteraceae bacterium CG07_land_8_20_14_0_80_61_8]